MPRAARVVLPNYPHHVIQRGHNREVVFAADEDYQYYLENLKEWKKELGCKIYAYSLMTNHVHLVIELWRADREFRFAHEKSIWSADEICQ